MASTQVFISFLRTHGIAVSVPEAGIAAGMAILGLLMVSAIPYRSFKELDLRHSYATLVFVVFAIALVVQEPSVSLFIIGLCYAFSGPLEWLWRRYTKRPLEESTESIPNEPEPAQG